MTTVLPRRRALVIGLDGATWNIARPLMEAGRMPNLARLVAQGTAGKLASTVPPITAAAWVSFLTGQNPGRHGVYQFRKMDLREYGGYRDEFANSGDYRGRSFIELVGQRGRRVGAVGIPMTYPPFPVNGFMVSGFPRPFGRNALVHPPELAHRLGRWDEMPDNFNFSLSQEETVTAAHYWVRKYTDIALAALEEEDFDLFLIVWNHTDNIPHLYWKYTDPAFPAYDELGADRFGDVINRQYELADQEIGRLLARWPEDGLVVVMSDHGMGPYPHRQVHLNAWLAEQGLLVERAGVSGNGSLLNRTIRTARRQLPTRWRHRLRDLVPGQLWSSMFRRQVNLNSVDWSTTAAYRLAVFPTVEGIVINLAGRQPQGIVQPGEAYESLCRRLVEALAALVDPATGRPVAARVSRREELFAGPHVSEIPDILVELNETFTGGDALSGPLFTPLSMADLSTYSATHRPDGLFVLAGPGIQPGAWLEGAHIVDMAPTVMALMGLPIAANMDGRVLEEALQPEAVRPWPAIDYGTDGLQEPASGLTDDEAAAFREQLAGLGYL